MAYLVFITLTVQRFFNKKLWKIKKNIVYKHRIFIGKFKKTVYKRLLQLWITKCDTLSAAANTTLRPIATITDILHRDLRIGRLRSNRISNRIFSTPTNTNY